MKTVLSEMNHVPCMAWTSPQETPLWAMRATANSPRVLPRVARRPWPSCMSDTAIASTPTASVCVAIREQAADAMQDSFLLAYARIGQLRDRTKVRPWLYAIARNECLRQLRANKRSVDLESVGEVADMNETSDAGLNAADARTLIDDAFAGMNTTDRDVLDLALRQDLDNSSIAMVLEVSDNNAAAKVSRAKSQLQNAVGALLLFRSRGSACADLKKDLGSSTEFNPLTRKRILRHAEDCSTCTTSRSKAVAALALVGLPLLAAPSWIREALLDSGVPQSGGTVSASDRHVSRDVNGQVDSSADLPSGRGEQTHGQQAPSNQGSSESAGQLPDLPAQSQSTPQQVDGQVSTSQATLAARAAEISQLRPEFNSDGWPVASNQERRLWPLIAVGAAVLVLLGATVGMVITGGQEPTAAEAMKSIEYPLPPSCSIANAECRPDVQGEASSQQTGKRNPRASSRPAVGETFRPIVRRSSPDRNRRPIPVPSPSRNPSPKPTAPETHPNTASSNTWGSWPHRGAPRSHSRLAARARGSPGRWVLQKLHLWEDDCHAWGQTQLAADVSKATE